VRASVMNYRLYVVTAEENISHAVEKDG